MQVVTYEHAQDADPKEVTCEWSDLVEELTTFEWTDCAPCPGSKCPAKNSAAWSPVVIAGRRKNENVRYITAAVFDLDHISLKDLEGVAQRLAGRAYVTHSTHSHHPPESNSLRLILPVSRAMLPQEWLVVREAVIKELGLPADPATKDFARLYYLPSAPKGSETIAEHEEGAPVDVDEVLKAARKAPAPPENAVDIGAVRKTLKSVSDPRSRALMARVLEGQPLGPQGADPTIKEAWCPDGYPGQDAILQKVCGIIAFACPNISEEIALEVLRPTLNLTKWNEGTDHLIAEAKKKLAAAAGRKAEKAEKEAEFADKFAKLIGRPPEEIAAATPETVAAVEAAEGAWREDLKWIQKDEDRKLRVCGYNAGVILRRDPAWKGALRFNEVTKAIEVVGGPLPPQQDVETLDTAIANWLANSEFELILDPHRITPQMVAVARETRYDPLREYLLGLKWDGVRRMDGFLTKYFGARSTTDEGEDISGYVREVGRKWLISAVARGLKPGERVDTVLILEGAQGIGKSRAVKALGVEWGTDSPLDINSKDGWMLTSCAWIVELAELDALRKTENTAQKAFFSRPTDKFRLPYGRTIEEFPRRCVFIGTANTDDYLQDPTGHRRYWPVRCGEIDIPALETDRDQLWAEAVVAYQAGEPWYFDLADPVLAQVKAEGAARDQGNPRAPVIREWWCKLSIAKRPAFVTTASVGQEALGVFPSQMTRALQMEIGEALKSLRFSRRRQRTGQDLAWVYIPPEDLVKVPQTAGKSMFEQIAAA